MTSKRPMWLPILAIWGVLIVGPLASLLPEAIGNPWRFMQDDGRHFVAWLRALDNPEFFSKDPISDYFRAVTPMTYEVLYTPATSLGIDIVQWHILVLMPGIMLLNIVALDRFISLFEADLVLRVALLLVSVGVYYEFLDNGLPRDFAIAIVCLSIFSYLKNKRWMLFALMLLGASVYPAATVTVGLGLSLFELIRSYHEGFDSNNLVTLTFAALCGATGLVLFFVGGGDFGPAFDLEEARHQPIFQEGGRTAYFVGSSEWERMTCGRRAGLFRTCGRDELWWLAYPLHFLVITAGFYLLSLNSQADWRILAGLCIAGVLLFIFATSIAFEAHLPSRYSRWSVQFVSSFCLILLFTAGLAKTVSISGMPKVLVPVLASVAFFGVNPEKIREFDDIINDPLPEISGALRQTPTDTVVAGLTRHVDNVPAFAARSVLASIELSVPYSKKFYREMERRVFTLKNLFEETDPKKWRSIHTASGVDMYLISNEHQIHSWKASFIQAPTKTASSIFDTYPNEAARCAVTAQNGLTLVEGHCFYNAIRKLE